MINVLDHGVVGDGLADDTFAIQSCIDTYRECFFPAGKVFKLDGARGLKLPSGCRLEMEGATFEVPNVGPRSRALETVPGSSGIRLRGGLVRGSRTPVAGLQWAIGLRIDSADDVLVEHMVFEDWYFDGLWIGGNSPSKNIHINQVDIYNSRRNALSVCNATNVNIYRSIFSDSQGQDPQSGIDVEPNANERVTGLTVVDCLFSSNSKGLYMHKGKGLAGEGYRILNCIFTSNLEYGLIGNSVDRLSVEACSIINSKVGASFGAKTKNLRLFDNEFSQIANNSLVLAGVDGALVAGNSGLTGKIAMITTADGTGVYGKSLLEF